MPKVLDCGAMHHARSLSALLYQDPDMTINLVELLPLLLKERVAVPRELKEMFPQVGVTESDWWCSDSHGGYKETR